jgi:hypothetical protein
MNSVILQDIPLTFTKMSKRPNWCYADIQKMMLNYAKIQNVREIPRRVGMLLVGVHSDFFHIEVSKLRRAHNQLN